MATKRAPARVRRSRHNDHRVSIRMYRHGLGDCFLLRFPRAGETSTFNVLIDCGLITVATGAKVKMVEVAKDIQKTCNSRIDVVVMTHEHWDHASGFSKEHAQDVFDKIEVKEVWYGWTEDPRSALGTKLRKEREDKVNALASAVSALKAVQGADESLASYPGIASVLGFFGLNANPGLAELSTVGKKIGKTREAFEYLKNRQGVPTRYCYPDKPPIELKGLDGVRVYVLGPPLDEGFIKRSAPTKTGKEVYELFGEEEFSISLGHAFDRMQDPKAPDRGGPFDRAFHCVDPGRNEKLTTLMDLVSWNDAGKAWRKIDYDWTQAAESLALNLDTHTNNTCLVLAFEFIESGDVLLFPADAQVGSWLSWQSLKWHVKGADGTVGSVSAPELLARTVFYKVGHHGSHNATLRELGLEQMVSDKLVAFIPVSVQEARKNRWNSMPFEPLVDRLKKKTQKRLIQADQEIPTDSSIKDIESSPLFYEILL